MRQWVRRDRMGILRDLLYIASRCEHGVSRTTLMMNTGLPHNSIHSHYYLHLALEKGLISEEERQSGSTKYRYIKITQKGRILLRTLDGLYEILEHPLLMNEEVNKENENH